MDYEKLYHKLFHATEQAIELLIAAQRECEELYLCDADAAAGGNDTAPSGSGAG